MDKWIKKREAIASILVLALFAGVVIGLNAKTAFGQGTTFNCGVGSGSVPCQITGNFTITTVPAPTDGPATLPTACVAGTAPNCVQPGYPDTSGYVVKTVCASGCSYATVQAALSGVHAAGGDTTGEIIELAPSVTFTENDTLPAYTMAAGKWVIVITNPSGYTPPSPGTRVASYTGMATIATNNTDPAIQTASLANHYYFMGVQIGVTNGTSQNYNVFAVGNGETTAASLPHHIYIDRCHVTGNLAGANANNVARDLEANGNYIAVINSVLDSAHEVGADAQAIAVWNGQGPFEFDNNNLQGASENILSGGADPTISNLVPSDLTITHNHFLKPLTWYSGSGSYGGVLWQVKNLLELKNVNRVRVERNILEYNWAQAQDGYGVLFTPRNQDGACPWCVVSNVTFRYNLFQHSGSGFNINGADAGSPCGGGAGPSLTSSNISVHDNLLLDINSSWGGANGRFLQILSGNFAGSCTVQGPQNSVFNHMTAFQNGKTGNTGDYYQAPTIGGFVFQNSIMPKGYYGFLGTNEAEGSGTLNAYMNSPYVFTANAFMNAGGNPGGYPAGNFWPTSWPVVDFVDSTNCPAGVGFPQTYAVTICALQAGSPYHNAGTDGADLGANESLINSAIQNVY